RLLLLHAVELDRGGDRVAGAAAELALVVDGRAVRGQVYRGRELAEDGGRRGEEMIARIRQIRNPAVPLGLADGRLVRGHRVLPPKELSGSYATIFRLRMAKSCICGNPNVLVLIAASACKSEAPDARTSRKKSARRRGINASLSER